MTREMKKSNIRSTADEYRRIAEAARAAGMSTNHYLITAGLAYAADREQAEHLSALIGARLAEQNDAVAAALLEQTRNVDELLAARHAELVRQIKVAFVKIRGAGAAANDGGTK